MSACIAPEHVRGQHKAQGQELGFWGEGSARSEFTHAKAQKSNRVKHCRWAQPERTVPDKPVETP